MIQSGVLILYTCATPIHNILHGIALHDIAAFSQHKMYEFVKIMNLSVFIGEDEKIELGSKMCMAVKTIQHCLNVVRQGGVTSGNT